MISGFSDSRRASSALLTPRPARAPSSARMRASVAAISARATSNSSRNAPPPVVAPAEGPGLWAARGRRVGYPTVRKEKVLEERGACGSLKWRRRPISGRLCNTEAPSGWHPRASAPHPCGAPLPSRPCAADAQLRDLRAVDHRRDLRRDLLARRKEKPAFPRASEVEAPGIEPGSERLPVTGPTRVSRSEYVSGNLRACNRSRSRPLISTSVRRLASHQDPAGADVHTRYPALPGERTAYI